MAAPDSAEARVTPYDLIGGADSVRRLVLRFYGLMDVLPEAAACRAIHPEDLGESRQKLFEYFSGWLGGPPLFVERRGPPMLRARHLHAPIGGAEIDGWLACFRQAWRESVDHPGLTQALMPKIEALALHMRNRAEDEAPGGPIATA